MLVVALFSGHTYDIIYKTTLSFAIRVTRQSQTLKYVTPFWNVLK